LNELPVILVVEDDQAIQGVIEEALSEGGSEVEACWVGLMVGKSPAAPERPILTFPSFT
jgi:CheY-like chemotaxis protein